MLLFIFQIWMRKVPVVSINEYMNIYEEEVLMTFLGIKEGCTHVSHTELRLLRTSNLLPKSISPTHYLFLGSQNKILQPYCRHPQISPGIHSRAPKEGKLKQTEYPSLTPPPKKALYVGLSVYKPVWVAAIDFPWERELRKLKDCGEFTKARQRQISHLSVLSFSTVQKSISDEFLWKLLKQCYFIKDLYKGHQICFPGVN